MIDIQSLGYPLRVTEVSQKLCARLRTISTEHAACEATACETEPSHNFVRPRYPCEPTTIRSDPQASASSIMAYFGWPRTISVDTRSLLPCALRTRSAALLTIDRA